MKLASFEQGSILNGKYCILDVIGEGGSSTVYRVMDLKLRKIWALKRIHKSERALSLYEAEVAVLKSLNHPHLPRIVDGFVYDRSCCIVMDYVTGIPLSRLGCEREYRVEELILWAMQTAEILAYLHRQKPPLYYQDLKPEHLILQKNGGIMLLDFGFGSEAFDPFRVMTPEYAAPEQHKTGHLSVQTDHYAFGRTFLVLLSGLKEKHVNMGRRGRRFQSILKKCTRAQPGRRYDSDRELLAALRQLKEERPAPHLVIYLLPLLTVGFTAAMMHLKQEEHPETVPQEAREAVERTAESLTEESDVTKSEEELKRSTLELLADGDCAGGNHAAAVMHLRELIALLEEAGRPEEEIYPYRLRFAKQAQLCETEMIIRSAWESVIRLDPNETEPYLLYISYLYQIGDLNRAAELYETVSHLPDAGQNPNFEAIRIKLEHAGALKDDRKEEA